MTCKMNGFYYKADAFSSRLGDLWGFLAQSLRAIYLGRERSARSYGYLVPKEKQLSLLTQREGPLVAVLTSKRPPL